MSMLTNNVEQDSLFGDVIYAYTRAQALADGYRVPRGGRGKRARLVTLKLHIGPSDQGEPVVTIMQPNED